MKKIILKSALIAIIISSAIVHNAYAQTKNNLQGKISISGAFALYPLTVKWAEEFNKIYPNIKIDISAGGAGKGITDVLSGITDIGLVSRDLSPEEIKKGSIPYPVSKDAVIPTISASNPHVLELQARGIKKDVLNNIFISGRVKSWGQTGIKSNDPIHIYTRSDAAGAAETWAKYFGKKQEDLQGVAVYGDPGLAMAVKKDPIGIGFNNIVYVFDSKTKKPTNGVVPLPIDLNNNGRIDADEDFYGDIDKLTNAIATGKYPSPPGRELLFVTKGATKNAAAKEFIKWVLTIGQKYVDAAGYIQLSPDRIKATLAKLK